MSESITYLGIDLGSFKTSVTSSNGRRHSLQTAVGWPKDHIARAMLGRDVVFGTELREQRLALDIVRPFEQGWLKYRDGSQSGLTTQQVAKHKEAARLLLQHAVSLTQPAPGSRLLGVIGAPSRASAQAKHILHEVAAETFDAVAIVPEPFTVAYGMERLTDTLIVDIGAGTTDLCPLQGTYPSEDSQVTVPIGGDVIDGHLHSEIMKAHPHARLSAYMVRDLKEKYGFVHEPTEAISVVLPTEGRPQSFEITECIRAACLTLVPYIVDSIREVIAKYDPEFQASLLKNIVLAGGGSQIKGLDRVLESALREYGDVSVSRVYDSVFAGAVGALKLAMEMPAEYWDSLKQSRELAEVA